MHATSEETDQMYSCPDYDRDGKKAVGKKIVDANLDDYALTLSFEDGSSMKIVDDGQCCCESRYITCDDDVKSLIGSEFVGINTRDHGTEGDEDYTVHEVMFVDVQTSTGFITMCTHNEHNGYYGGFNVEAQYTGF
jgi:hypothetical protein